MTSLLIRYVDWRLTGGAYNTLWLPTVYSLLQTSTIKGSHYAEIVQKQTKFTFNALHFGILHYNNFTYHHQWNIVIQHVFL